MRVGSVTDISPLNLRLEHCYADSASDFSPVPPRPERCSRIILVFGKLTTTSKLRTAFDSTTQILVSKNSFLSFKEISQKVKDFASLGVFFRSHFLTFKAIGYSILREKQREVRDFRKNRLVISQIRSTPFPPVWGIGLRTPLTVIGVRRATTVVRIPTIAPTRTRILVFTLSSAVRVGVASDFPPSTLSASTCVIPLGYLGRYFVRFPISRFSAVFSPSKIAITPD